MITPIQNNTILNTSLFTDLSSGAIDNVMNKESSPNQDITLAIDAEKYEKIPIGDRNTIFLNQLFTNYFLIDIQRMKSHQSLIVNFKTTKDYSFSIKKETNKDSNNIYIIRKNDAQFWSKSTVNNLNHFFIGNEDKILEFNVILHKASEYRYVANIYYSLDHVKYYQIQYRHIDYNQYEKNSYAELIKENDNHTILDTKTVDMKPRYGRILKEWNTKPDGTGISYQPNDVINNVTADIILYAIYKAK